MSSNINYYKELMDASYSKVVERLQEKYGECRYDYFNKTSFENLAKKNFKTINGNDRKPNYNKKRSRFSEGLVLHHIDERRISNLSNLKNIKKYPDFKYQQKDHIVYCNLLEHLILHVLIAKETNNKLSVEGYKSLPQQIISLYGKENINNRENLLTAITLEKSECEEILDLANKVINR